MDEVSFPLGKRILKVNTMLSLDGFRVCIAGSGSGGKTLRVSSFVPFSAGAEWQLYLKRLERLVEKAAANKHFVYSPAHDKVTAEQNLRLYDLYVEKLRHSIYTRRVNAPIAVFEGGRGRFEALAPVQQAQALLNMHAVFGRVSGGVDLTLIGGVSHAAATVNFSCNMENWKKFYNDARIVDCSASGLWESVSDNLLDLL